MSDQVRSFLDEFPAIRQMWRSFVIALAIAIVAIWVIVNWAYGARMDTLRDRIDGKDEEITELAGKLKIAEEKAATSTEFKIELSPVKDCRYTNQTVEVDGKLFIDCVFTNVTFRYMGTGQVSFMRSKFIGFVGAETNFKPARVYYQLIGDLESMSGRGKFQTGERMEGGVFIPYKEPTMNDPKPYQS